MGDKLHNIVRALWVYLVCCYQVLSFDVTKSGQAYIRAGSQTTLTCDWTPPGGIGLFRVNWRQGSTVIAAAITPDFTPQYPVSRVRDRVALGTLTSSSTSTSITLTGLQCPGDIAEYTCEVQTNPVILGNHQAS
ncbi:uncharacterized protein LOC106181020 [Lingula anatina]|uniref:Uncharacterized protein LOC106181020 n=1 Tax=Lingula anatina TaxID=7574 RepID=A0A1S3KE33_LINAN|nr:uncharacterized protein LOC106181020 [Lingula anatina]|eukprot:XP_013420714.1 uncharacterized protein LOC106181020 [Lingula anatina]